MHHEWMRRFAVLLVSLLVTLAPFLCAHQGESLASAAGQEVQNLRAFARLYGYVKYFHPSDEASRVDWDMFAIRGARQVKTARSREDLKRILEDLFLPIAPTVKIYYAGERSPEAPESLPRDPQGLEVAAWQHRGLGVGALTSEYASVRARRPYSYFFGKSDDQKHHQANQASRERRGFPAGNLFAEYPRPGEVADKELDRGLRCCVPLTVFSDRTATRLGRGNHARNETVSGMEDLAPDEVTAADEYVRLADVIIAWNVFQHFYPYLDVVEVDWGAELTNALRAAMADRTERDFFFTLNRLIAGLQDGHARVFHRLDEEQAWLPFDVDWIEDRLVITSSGDSARFRPGDIVLKIDGMGAGQALAYAETYISGSPQWKKHVALMRFGYGDPGTVARLVVVTGDETHTVEVRRDYYGTGGQPVGPSIRELETGIYYVDLTRATMRSIRARMNRLAEARAVIFDLRGDAKGNHDILSHLLKEKAAPRLWRMIIRTIYPDQEHATGFEDVGWRLEPRLPRIKADVAFLTDARTISYAEYFVSYVEYFRLGEIVGQPTAGALGSVNAFELPGGFGITWTGMKVVKLDGTRCHAIGFQPTLLVERSVKAVVENRDEFVEAALALITQRKPPVKR